MIIEKELLKEFFWNDYHIQHLGTLTFATILNNEKKFFFISIKRMKENLEITHFTCPFDHVSQKENFYCLNFIKKPILDSGDFELIIDNNQFDKNGLNIQEQLHIIKEGIIKINNNPVFI